MSAGCVETPEYHGTESSLRRLFLSITKLLIKLVERGLSISGVILLQPVDSSIDEEKIYLQRTLVSAIERISGEDGWRRVTVVLESILSIDQGTYFLDSMQPKWFSSLLDTLTN